MSYAPVTTARTVATLIENIVTHTRPATEAEILQAMNFGMGKVVRAMEAVRPQVFLAWVDGFTISSGVAEYDLSVYSPAVLRPVRLTVPGNNTPAIAFRYRALMDPEYEIRDGSVSSTVSTFLYDVLSGLFPRTAIAYDTTFTPSAGQVAFTAITDAVMQATFPLGSTVLLPKAGPVITAGTLGGVPQDLFTTVIGYPVAQKLQLADPLVAQSGAYGSIASQAIVPIWRRVLRIAPTPATSYSGRLYYQHSAGWPLQSLDEMLDGWFVRFQDCLVEYACSQLLKGTADTMHRDHLEAANDLRAELIQEIEPLSAQNGEALSSGLGDD